MKSPIVSASTGDERPKPVKPITSQSNVKELRAALQRAKDKRNAMQAALSASRPALHHAIENGDMELIAQLFSEGASVVGRDAAGNTAMHAAARRSNNCRTVVQFLVEQRVSLNTMGENQETPLMAAIPANGAPLRIDAAAALLDEGADPRIPDQSGKTVIQRLNKLVAHHPGLAGAQSLLKAMKARSVALNAAADQSNPIPQSPTSLSPLRAVQPSPFLVALEKHGRKARFSFDGREASMGASRRSAKGIQP